MRKIILFSLVISFLFSTSLEAQRKKSKDKKTEQTTPKPKKKKSPQYSEYIFLRTNTFMKFLNHI